MKGFLAFMLHFKFVVSFFDVTNRLYVVDFTSIALNIDVACKLRIVKAEAVALWAADATRRLNIMAFVTVKSYKPNNKSYKYLFLEIFCLYVL